MLSTGTITGWAFADANGLISSGTIDLQPKRFEGGGMRYIRFNDALQRLHADCGGFGRILFEEVRRHRGVNAAHIYGGFMASLMAWAEAKQIPYASIPVGTWKKSIVGKGNASKSEVIAAVRSLGFSPIDENEADALGVLLTHLRGAA